MEIDARNFKRLGLLMNLVVAIALVALVVKAFTERRQPPAYSVAEAQAAAVMPANDATVTVVATPLPAPTATTAAVVATAAVTPTLSAPTATTAPTNPTTAAVAPSEESAAATNGGAAAEAPAAVVDAVAKGTCNACHTIPGVAGAVGVVGPNLANIGNDAANRIPGYTAEAYIHESIVDPNAFVAPQCPFGTCVAGSMPTTLAQTLSENEINAVVNYLLTLKDGE